MNFRKSSKNQKSIMFRYVVLISVFALLGSITACSLPFKVVPNNYEEGPPPGEEFHEEEHWEEGEPPPEGHVPGEEPPTESPPNEPPPPAPPSNAPPPASSNSGGGAFSADVSVTDIYPGNQPQGQFHVRITNHGPGTLNNVKVPVLCQYERTDKNTKAQSAKSATIQVILSIKPGEQMSFPTTLTLDTNVYEYLVACEVQPNFDDPDPGNNNYNEPIY